MYNLRLKAKVLLLLILCAAALGVNLGGGTATAVCGRCSQVLDGTEVVGYGCVQSTGSSCVASSTGCTQCASCSCRSDDPVAPPLDPPDR